MVMPGGKNSEWIKAYRFVYLQTDQKAKIT